MVARVLRLRLAILANGLRRPPAQAVGMALAATVALVLAVALIRNVAELRSETDEITHAILIVLGSALTLGFVVMPLVFATDDPLDPRRFALFGIRPRRLALVLASTGAVSVPLLLLFAILIAQMVAWSRGPLPSFLSFVTLLLVLPTCVLLGRIGSAVSSAYLSGRRAREISSAAMLALVAVAAPMLAILVALDWQTQGLTIVRRIAGVLAWTPLGAPWSLPGNSLVNRGDQTLGQLMVGVVTLAVLWGVWELLVRLLLTRGERPIVARDSSRLGWFDRFPGTPAGAIAARSASYWVRDARYGLAVAVIPVVPVVMAAALLIGGVPWSVIAWVPVPVMALFLGWMVHNDVAHDSSAFWLHVSASTSGVDDRVGRIAPALVLGIPLVLGGSVITAALAGNWAALPGFIGLATCTLLVGLGVSSVISAAFPYATVHPGDSPFAQPQAAGANGSVVQSFSFLASVLAAVPVAWLAFLGETQGAGWHWGALAAGLVIGGGSLVLGVWWGARIVARTGPELLAFTLRN